MRDQRAGRAAQRQDERPAREQRVHHRVRAHIRKRRTTNLAYRVIVGLVGLAVIGLGVVLLPLPGPGWLVIFAGLFVLSTEFSWAHRLLHFAHEKVDAWTDWVRRQSLLVRALLAFGCLLIVAAAVGTYVAWAGVPDWVPLIG